MNVAALYTHGAEYSYENGYNLKAITALVLGILPNIPGFLVQIQVLSPDSFLGGLAPFYHYAWFIGFFIAGASYAGLMNFGEAILTEEQPA